MEMIYLQPANVPKPAGEYSQGVKVKPGTLVVISGQVAWDVEGDLVGKGDIRAQSRQVFENLKNMLASAGATFKDVVKLGIFLKHRDDFAAFREIRGQYLTPPFPPTTLLVVKSLTGQGRVAARGRGHGRPGLISLQNAREAGIFSPDSGPFIVASKRRCHG